jgi:hypothetical protein
MRTVETQGDRIMASRNGTLFKPAYAHYEELKCRPFKNLGDSSPNVKCRPMRGPTSSLPIRGFRQECPGGSRKVRECPSCASRSLSAIHGSGCWWRRRESVKPVSPVNPNPMMANDFGFYVMKASELPRRFESPGVLPSLGDIMETAGHVNE